MERHKDNDVMVYTFVIKPSYCTEAVYWRLLLLDVMVGKDEHGLNLSQFFFQCP